MKLRFFALPLMLAGVANAQLPGSGGYGGPAVLSRGLGQLGQRSGEPVSIRPYARILGSYDTGFVPAASDQTGDVDNPGGLYGIEAEVGVYGTHRWRRSSLGLEYIGDYRHYNANTYYNGSDHVLALDYQRQTSRRTFLAFKQFAGSTSRSFGGVLGGIGGQLVDSPAIPVNDVFDNRAYFLDSLVSFGVQKGARNSFNFSGGGFLVRRQSNLLYGVNGYRAQADYARRISRRKTVSIAYQFLHFDFPHGFGSADIQGLAAGYGQQIGRNWQVAANLGIYRVDVVGLRRITLDPLLADLLGRTTGIEAFDHVNYVPNVLATLTRSFRKSALQFSYMRSVYPGNGVLLTSKTENGAISYTYAGVRRWSFTTFGNYNRIAGLGNYAGAFNAWGSGASASRFLGHGAHLNFGADIRRYDSSQSGFRRDGKRVFVGFAFAPGDIPLSLR